MCLDDRYTTRRGRSGVPETLLRTRRCRRLRRSACDLVRYTVRMSRLSYFAACAVLPALRRTFSPWYRMPLPLYGSGGRTLRISAATCPTNSLSTPSIFTCVLLSTVTLMPLGVL